MLPEKAGATAFSRPSGCLSKDVTCTCDGIVSEVVTGVQRETLTKMGMGFTDF